MTSTSEKPIISQEVDFATSTPAAPRALWSLTSGDQRFASRGIRQRYNNRRVRQPFVRLTPIDSAGDIAIVEIISLPSSREQLLASRLTHALEACKLSESWPVFVATRVGHSEIVDLAVEALANAQQYAASRYVGSPNRSLMPYTNALTKLRCDLNCPEKIHQDDTVITVALLALVEHLLSPISPPFRSHLHGLYALLAHRPPSHPDHESDVIRAIFYDHWTFAFLKPCVQGTASPFDRDDWCRMQPVAMDVLQPAVITLRRIANELFIRFPRLIAHIRDARQRDPPELKYDAVTLAAKLVGLKDAEAENELLHQVELERTSWAVDQEIIPVSFRFLRVAQYEAAIYYWQAQLFLARICKRANELVPEDEALPVDEDEMRRMCKNIFMSFQYTLGAGMPGISAVQMAVVACWGSLIDFPKLFEPKFNAETLRSWIVESINAMTQGWFVLTS
ncbi:hypothetical protein BAUCODRAFT_158831 [Baudoinia panamericana UAMH 10762]|uniref:Uncharacterized protein n=1 Tax=Baudoinia panamericana (strain UAMH 10762) TaxID=717646 RepID=M2MRX3_BAUPA|nr:uncharacterized protein BAUCODRAFT_158831 [Baudoinia panamericana UAMH 10762]EMC94248.1 hypothetical protein BAUCODRAFT_158831 [Baudoinia panamericana UAMH 10762]